MALEPSQMATERSRAPRTPAHLEVRVPAQGAQRLHIAGGAEVTERYHGGEAHAPVLPLNKRCLGCWVLIQEPTRHGGSVWHGEMRLELGVQGAVDLAALKTRAQLKARL